MDINYYQALAARTLRPERPQKDLLQNCALGLGGEAGEVLDLVKKWVYHGHDLDDEAIKTELGDIMWYVAGMATSLGVGLDEIAEGNIEKLKARYPDGFDEERSKNRSVPKS